MKATIAITAATLLCAGPALAQESATATMMDQSGAEVATVTLTPTASGVVLVEIEGTALPEGEHGFHIHETGECTGDFTSAGGHLPGDRQHGIMVEGGPHPGDMPNLHIAADGTVRDEVFNGDLTMEQVFDEDGSAVMVHSGPDDYKSQPSGDAGNRIACGVIEQG